MLKGHAEGQQGMYKVIGYRCDKIVLIFFKSLFMLNHIIAVGWFNLKFGVLWNSKPFLFPITHKIK
jgi:hypothetical protein